MSDQDKFDYVNYSRHYLLMSRFVAESNMIEGIPVTTTAQVKAHEKFWEGLLTVDAVIALVKVLQPDALPRFDSSIPGVRVGPHVAPPSSPSIRIQLEAILKVADPWEQHCLYKDLHPFTDGNGRSGRAIWGHRMLPVTSPAFQRKFLHSFYYQTLASKRKL